MASAYSRARFGHSSSVRARRRFGSHMTHSNVLPSLQGSGAIVCLCVRRSAFGMLHLLRRITYCVKVQTKRKMFWASEAA